MSPEQLHGPQWAHYFGYRREDMSTQLTVRGVLDHIKFMTPPEA